MTPISSSIPLEDFIKRRGRNRAAIDLGCTGPALSKAIAASRTIFVKVAADGSSSATEISKFPIR
ncbi:Cro/CI family transcriptional regulator [Pseudomonas sp. HN8-3]|uniref:Cro/CI family transcriptional regulator n=1 Tax=Pseudomonas sp. HN8-3 TaxID=2886361 RepID=UPI003A4DD842|nr:Cro/CI family transcriptional regulator [Pseudomonas sp. HN8-3]